MYGVTPAPSCLAIRPLPRITTYSPKSWSRLRIESWAPNGGVCRRLRPHPHTPIAMEMDATAVSRQLDGITGDRLKKQRASSGQTNAFPDARGYKPARSNGAHITVCLSGDKEMKRIGISNDILKSDRVDRAWRGWVAAVYLSRAQLYSRDSHRARMGLLYCTLSEQRCASQLTGGERAERRARRGIIDFHTDKIMRPSESRPELVLYVGAYLLLAGGRGPYKPICAPPWRSAA